MVLPSASHLPPLPNCHQFFLFVVSQNALLTAPLLEVGVCTFLIWLLFMFISPWKVWEPFIILLLVSVASDGSLRLITFLLFTSKLPVIFWLPSNCTTVKRSAEPPLPDNHCGPCAPVSPLSPLGP